MWMKAPLSRGTDTFQHRTKCGKGMLPILTHSEIIDRNICWRLGKRNRPISAILDIYPTIDDAFQNAALLKSGSKNVLTRIGRVLVQSKMQLPVAAEVVRERLGLLD